jgi:transcriptional regulator NrdR family protein
MDVIITKASGEKEPFTKNKLRQSLLRAGATEALADQIV